jgi:geranylgeranyl diphosphate synthase type II
MRGKPGEGMVDLKVYLGEQKALVDQALGTYLPVSHGPAAELVQAMRYSLFAGGKRLRPVLCIAAARAVGGEASHVLPVACALEMIHTYSLIHDDLPAMDDDDLRRGEPTSHKMFGEGMAILAGDALLTHAFSLMASPELMEQVGPGRALQVIGLIAGAAGHQGMVGGQAMDIQSEGKQVELSTVEFIHTHKTADLIAASLTAGALLGGGDTTQVSAITAYGRKIGLAFQISDDILDIEGDSALMGKPSGSDQAKAKVTYPGVLGLEVSRNRQRELVESAVDALASFDRRAEPLRSIARYIIERKK